MAKAIQEEVAKVLLINEKHEMLVLTVGEYKGRPDKSYQPDLPGGMVDAGETSLVAVRREVIEETGITLSLDDFHMAYSHTAYYEGEHKSVTKHVYVVLLNHTPPVAVSWEHASYAWEAVEGITQRIAFRPFYKEAIEYCKKIELI